MQVMDNQGDTHGRTHIPAEVLRPFSRVLPGRSFAAISDGAGNVYSFEQIALHVKECEYCRDTLEGLRAQNRAYWEEFEESCAAAPPWVSVPVAQRIEAYRSLVTAMRGAELDASESATDEVLTQTSAAFQERVAEDLRQWFQNAGRRSEKVGRAQAEALIRTVLSDASSAPVDLDLKDDVHRAFARALVHQPQLARQVRFLTGIVNDKIMVRLRLSPEWQTELFVVSALEELL